MQDYGLVSIIPPTWHVQRFINLFINRLQMLILMSLNKIMVNNCIYFCFLEIKTLYLEI